MKTTRTRTAAEKLANNIKVLEAVVAMAEQGIKGSQGDDRLRRQVELDGARAALRSLGA